MSRPLVSLSVVSHGQSALVENLLGDLDRLPSQPFEVIVTSNLPESDETYAERPYPLMHLKNAAAKGFGANHNAAFEHCRGRYFAVVNPDIRIPALDFPRLLVPFEDAHIGAVAPMVLSGSGGIEDSARRFPTLWRLTRRAILRQRTPDYHWEQAPIGVDWVAGMFVVFRPDLFKQLGGFDDTRFFMYFEDVDICRRLRSLGRSVVLQPQVSVTHEAQRASHRSLKHLRWHLTSAVRYLSGL